MNFKDAMALMAFVGLAAVLVLGLASAPSAAVAQDDDNDGLTAEQEAILGTDPADPDTDGDGWPDGHEYFATFTDPLMADTDGDGRPDSQDPYPRKLVYQDVSGVTTTEDRLLGSGEDLRLHQLVQVKVGNVITIDWTNFLNRDFTLRETRFVWSVDFLDPGRRDFAEEGYYRPVETEEGPMMEVRLPGYEDILEVTIPWPGNAMTISDWIYHLYSEPLRVGQTWEFNVFYHELLRWGEDPFFRARAEITGEVTVPLETRLGRREYRAYEIRAVFRHETFKDPFFAAFLGEDPELVLQALIAAGDGPQTQILLRYTTPFFRITPTQAVSFSDFLVQR